MNVTHVADIWHHRQTENIKFSHLVMMSYHISPTRRQSQRIHTSTKGTGINTTLCKNRKREKKRSSHNNITSESKFCTLFKEYKCGHIQCKYKRNAPHTTRTSTFTLTMAKKQQAKKQKQQKVYYWIDKGGGEQTSDVDGGFLLAVCQEIYDKRLVDSWKLSSLKSFSFEPRIKSVQSTRGYKLVSTRLNTLIVYKS